MKLEDRLKTMRVWMSPMTNIIYAGYIEKTGKLAVAKVDVTDQVINRAVDYVETIGRKEESIHGAPFYVLDLQNGGRLVFYPGPGENEVKDDGQ